MSNPLNQKTSATNSLNSSQVVVEKTRRGSSSVEVATAAATKETSGNLLLLSHDSSSSTAVPPLPSAAAAAPTTATTTRSNSTAHPQQQQQQQQQHQPQSQKDFSLQVSYITSTSIFVPEISIAPNSATTISSSSTILHQLPSEDAPDQSLANIVGATSAAGSGLMVHIFRFVTNTDSDNNNNNSAMMRKRHSVVSNTNTNKSNNNYNHPEQQNTTHSSSSSAALPEPPPPPPLVALLDEEEASNLRGAGSSSEVSPLKLEQRVMSIKKNVKSLRFLPDELDRFLHSASLDQEATDLIKKLVDSGQEQYLAAVAGVFVGKLPQLRIHSYEEGASFVKVLVR